MTLAENTPRRPCTPVPTAPTIAVANCITGPAELEPWIRSSFQATFATLEGVEGVREFRLARLTETSRECVFVSITLWDTLEAFERWSTSKEFRAAHPDRAEFQAEFGQMTSQRCDIDLEPHTTNQDLNIEILHRLLVQAPDLVPDGSTLVDELHWTQPAPARRRVLPIAGIACAAAFLAFCDSAIVNLAYSAVAAQFPTAGQSLTWVISGYAVTFAAILAAAGRLADTLGHRRILLCGVAGFALSSLACALAPTATALIAARMVQGATAALLLPAALGALLAAVDARRTAAAIGAWAAAGALAAALGPTLGAMLVDLWGWRSLFLINLPVCAILLGLGAAVLPRTQRSRRELPDIIGVVALCVGIAALVAAVTEGHTWGYHAPVTVTFLLVGVIGCATSLRRSRSNPRPAFEVRLWQSSAYAISNAVNFALGFAMGALLLGTPLFLQNMWRLTLLDTAGCIGIVGIAAMLSSATSGRLAAATSARWLCGGGLTLIAAACTVLVTDAMGSQQNLAVWWLVALTLGTGIGATVTGLSLITAVTVPAASISAGLGLGLTARQTGSAFGVAVLAALLESGPAFLASFHRLFAIVTLATLMTAVVSMAMITSDDVESGLVALPSDGH